MLLFTIGPVQSFIAQARKARDLWLGSFLLSSLMQAGMENTKDQLIFPVKPVIQDNIPDLPNKYIAIFESKNRAEETAKKSEEAIKSFWNDICIDVWRKIFDESQQRISNVTREMWNGQVKPDNMLEFYWVVVERKEGESYADWLKRTQARHSQRKYLRDFKQQIEVGEKSTISGEREALRGPGESRIDVQMFWYQIAREQSARDISQDGTERLDAIDTVKRFAHYSPHLAQKVGRQKLAEFKVGFPSVSSIATASFVEQLLYVNEEKTVANALDSWLEISKELNEEMPANIPFLATLADNFKQGKRILKPDGDCFFPETFSEKRLEKEFGFDNSRKTDREEIAKEAPKAIRNLLRATDACTPPITRPTPYYAMVQMDGDRMGTFIGGVESKDEHTAISSALSDFSRSNVPALVEKSYPGKLIYAGGDDVFALAPLARDTIRGEEKPIRTVLNLVDQLQMEYQERVKKEVKDIVTGKKTNVESPRSDLVTASAGITIAHHYTSLSYVRRISKEAEELAKEHYGRNALVVTVLRRSGEQTRVGCRWSYKGLEQSGQPIELFSFFYELFVDDILSPSCVHTLLEEAPTLIGLDREAQISEFKRVLKRQRDSAERSKERFPDPDVAEKARQLVMLAEKMDEVMETLAKEKDKDEVACAEPVAVELYAEGRRYGLVEVLGWLLVVLFLARKEVE